MYVTWRVQITNNNYYINNPNAFKSQPYDFMTYLLLFIMSGLYLLPQTLIYGFSIWSPNRNIFNGEKLKK